MAKVIQSKFSPEKRERLAEIVKLKAEKEKRLHNLDLENLPKFRKDPSPPKKLKGGGIATRGLGRAFMKGGKV